MISRKTISRIWASAAIIICGVPLVSFVRWSNNFNYERDMYAFTTWFSGGYLPEVRKKTGSWIPKKDGFIAYLKSQPDYLPNDARFREPTYAHDELIGIKFISTSRYKCRYELTFTRKTLVCESEIDPKTGEGDGGVISPG